MSPTLTGNVLSWASDPEPKAMAQAQRTAAMPFVHGHVALMPDMHLGMGATIGSVVATKGAIMPSAVGVDIGCGMHAMLTPFTSAHLPDGLDQLHAQIARSVPAGVGQGHETGGRGSTAIDSLIADGRVDLTPKQRSKAATQMGSLGSGNHFVEVCLDELDRVWLMLHSGSRGIGNELATQHIECAKGLMKQMFIHLEDPDLAYLVEGTPEFDAYINAMLWAQDWALANRDTMLEAVAKDFARFVGCDFQPLETVRCHHNFCEMEHHHGQNVWVTRKGAIRARTGDVGVIPGSMGTRSYIVKGKGSAASYQSSSHGAGRLMSRMAAKRDLDLDGLRSAMAGKAWNESNAAKLIDEDPRSYKDIEQVMADQDDLVEIRHTLSQILNFKGV